MRRAGFIAAALLFLLALVSCGSRYASRAFGVSFTVPDTWGIEEDAASICFIAPAGTAGDTFMENVVYAGSVPLAGTGCADLAAFADVMQETASESSGYEAVSRERTELAGMEAVVFTYRCYSQPIETTIQQRMYLLYDGTDAYTVVYTATADTFDQYADAADSIAGSFRAK